MFNRNKGTAIIALILMAAILGTLSPYIASVKAQSQATVNISEAIGGSVDPQPGTYNYNAGIAVTLAATPDGENGFQFASWIISTDAGNDTVTDNPYSLTVTGGVTYTVSAVFYEPVSEPILPRSSSSPSTAPIALANAVVVILHAVGGHTSPAEGTYFLLPNAAHALMLTAIPDHGWEFSHWAISGDPLTGHGGSPLTLTPTDNPYSVDHGFGYTFAYQPVFVQAGTGTHDTTASTTGGLSTETIIIVALVVIVIILAAISVYFYSKRSKK